MKKLFTSSVVAAGILFSSIAAADVVAEGKALAYDKKKGNCLACHMAGDGDLPGNIAPPLIAMKARFPNQKDLFNQISEPRTKNKDSMMPPFGTHNILSDGEINKIIAFMYTL